MRINRVTQETIDGRTFFRKEREAFSWILIVLGNCVFRFRRVPVHVLHQRQWLQWEQAIHAALDVDVPSQTSRGLLLPKISGRPLCDVGSDGDLLSFDDVIHRLKLALEALYRLHQIEVVVDGKPVLVSHGDASVTNAIIAEDKKSATWLDFDLRHDLRQPASVRHADDLRAFTMTAAGCLAVEDFSDELVQRYVRSTKQAYPNEETWSLMVESGDSFWNAFDVFSSAQRSRGKLAR